MTDDINCHIFGRRFFRAMELMQQNAGFTKLYEAVLSYRRELQCGTVPLLDWRQFLQSEDCFHRDTMDMDLNASSSQTGVTKMFQTCIV